MRHSVSRYFADCIPRLQGHSGESKPGTFLERWSIRCSMEGVWLSSKWQCWRVVQTFHPPAWFSSFYDVIYTSSLHHTCICIFMVLRIFSYFCSVSPSLPFCYVRFKACAIICRKGKKLPTCNCQGRTELLFYELRCTNSSLFSPRGAKDVSMLNLHTCNVCQVCSSTPLHLIPFMHSSAWFLSVRQRKRAFAVHGETVFLYGSAQIKSSVCL